VPFSEFERDAAAGDLPDFALIEPNMMAGHGDYHPAMGRSFTDRVEIEVDSPSSILSGEAFLARVFDAYRSAVAHDGANVWNTALLVGWDEPGGTYDHVPPGPAVPPDPSAPPGECNFTFDRSGYRVPAIIVSPWVEPFGRRDAMARTFDHVVTLDRPRDPAEWATITPRAVPAWTMDPEVVGKAVSTLGRGMGPALISKVRDMGVTLPPELSDPDAHLTPALVVPLLRDVARHLFPLLGESAA
jgi:phospholipase C